MSGSDISHDSPTELSHRLLWVFEAKIKDSTVIELANETQDPSGSGSKAYVDDTVRGSFAFLRIRLLL